MATHVQYQCINCKCTAHVKPPVCWRCGSADIHVLLAYTRNPLPDIQRQIQEDEARRKIAAWNEAVSIRDTRYPRCEQCDTPIAPVSGTTNRGFEALCDGCYQELMDERDEGNQP